MESLRDEEKTQRQEFKNTSIGVGLRPLPEFDNGAKFDNDQINPEFDKIIHMINDEIDEKKVESSNSVESNLRDPAKKTLVEFRIISSPSLVGEVDEKRTRSLSFAEEQTESQCQKPSRLYPKQLNPFTDVDDEVTTDQKGIKPKADIQYDLCNLNKVQQRRFKARSGNPFDEYEDDDDYEDEEKEGNVTDKKRKIIEAPRIRLNPFSSDDSGSEELDLELGLPPTLEFRMVRHSLLDHRDALQSNCNMNENSVCSTNTLTVSNSATLTRASTCRKKKQAPPPPLSLKCSSLDTSVITEPSFFPQATPRTKKNTRAPPPPPSLPLSRNTDIQFKPEWQEIQIPWGEEKVSKDEANRATQNILSVQGSACCEPSREQTIESKWKRKKGLAPSRPMPLRRKIKVISMKDVKLELDQIEIQQQGLEKQGVQIEQIIRNKCESNTASQDTSLGLDVEELVLDLFALVNEKNELFRRQAELILLKRQQRLEEEHADIEYQVRCLISQPETTKTDFDKQREETLIHRLLEIVKKRNEIIECLEIDRKRELEEDRSIHREMNLYATRNKVDIVNVMNKYQGLPKLKKGKIQETIEQKKCLNKKKQY